MIRRAEEYMPGLGKLSVLRAWTGFRAATADKLPLIGPATGLCDDPTLWLSAGFEGLGITNAPGAARLLLDCMQGRNSAIPIEPYLPSRLMFLPAAGSSSERDALETVAVHAMGADSRG
jgi:glycine/D-amino acid oxidase-like deaminating enzyme